MEQNELKSSEELNEIVTIGEWFITMLLMIIPLVNIILLFVWAFGSNMKISKSNWAKAQLIWMAIGFILSIIFVIFSFTFFKGITDYFRLI
jgi:amino acid transporter